MEESMRSGRRRDSLVLNNTNPGSLLAVAGTQPNIVRGREPNLDREMGPRSRRVRVFPVKKSP